MTKNEQGKMPIENFIMIEKMVIMAHFLLTFFLERTCFVFKDNFSFVNEIARNNYVSDKFEMFLVYLLSKLCAAIFIAFFWRIVFGIIKKRIPGKTALLFGFVFLIGVAIGWCQYPNMFSLAIDNYTTYAQAIRFVPTYWQSVYTGVVYAGSMMVVPHPFAIYLFQWLLFVGVVGYIYNGVEKTFNSKNLKYLTLLLFFLPESYYLVFDAYRNNYFAMLCLFYFAYIFFALRKPDVTVDTKELVGISLLSAFIAVWRSEGFLVGAGGIVMLCFLYHKNWKKLISIVVIFLGAVLLLNSVQGIGAKKYYGKDYSIVNTTDVLRNILNDPNTNLLYPGAEEDLMALEEIIPIQVLKEAGMTGFRNYNWTSGRENFNQTLASDEAAAAYMSAYYRIIWNNMSGYLNVQTNAFFEALGLQVRHTVYGYTGTNYTNLESFQYHQWLIGYEELQDTPFTTKWVESPKRIWLYNVTTWALTVWRELWTGFGIDTLLHIVILLADFFLLIWGFIQVLLEKQKRFWEYIIYFLIILGEFAALFLFMPVGRTEYLYPMLYSSYLILFFFLAENKFEIKKIRGEENEE